MKLVLAGVGSLVSGSLLVAFALLAASITGMPGTWSVWDEINIVSIAGCFLGVMGLIVMFLGLLRRSSPKT
jgi:hypothetical protein